MTDQTPAQEALPLFYLAIADLASLGAMYMPFIRNGGLFVPVSKDIEPGTTVFVLIRLMAEQKSWPVCAQVVWKTGADSGRTSQGIGIQFLDTEHKLKRRLETLIGENDSRMPGMFWQQSG